MEVTVGNGVFILFRLLAIHTGTGDLNYPV